MKKVNYEASELEAIRRYTAGVKPSSSTFIDEETLTYGYGELSDFGSFEFQIPHEVLSQGEALTVKELMKQVEEKFSIRD